MAIKRDMVSNLAATAAGFAYLTCGVDRELRVSEELKHAADFEAALYQTQPAYRDHLLHVRRVCSVGYTLLTISGRNCFNETPCRARSKRLKNWCVAGLFHDLGYMLESYRALSQMGKAYTSAHVQQLLASLDKELARSALEMNQDASFHGLRTVLDDRLDHGVVSFLHLRRLLRNIANGRAPAAGCTGVTALEEEYEDALVAILKHNLLREPIDAEKEPLAALLVFCDELQEWGRMRFGYGELTRAIMELVNFRRISEVDGRQLTKKVQFDEASVEFADGRLRRKKNQKQIWLRVHYSDQNKNVFDPLSVLLFKLCSFQRLRNTERMALGMTLRFGLLKGPGRDTSGHDGEQPPKGSRTDAHVATAHEMDILSEFVLRKDAGFINEELFTPGTPEAKTTQPYTYVRTQDADEIYINFALLDRQATRPFMSRLPWEFLPELYRFKRKWVRENGVPCTFLDERDS